MEPNWGSLDWAPMDSLYEVITEFPISVNKKMLIITMIVVDYQHGGITEYTLDELQSYTKWNRPFIKRMLKQLVEANYLLEKNNRYKTNSQKWAR